MQYNHKLVSGFAILAAIFFGLAGCNKSYFYPGINTDPTRVSSNNLVPSVLLSGAESSIGFTVGGDVTRFSAIFDQYAYGGDNQFIPYTQYQISSPDFDNVWENIYTQGIGTLRELQTLSKANGYGYYEGISDILLAYEFGIATDMWGDVPYTQAGAGANILQPVYDKQSDIYPSLISMLDSSVTLLSAASGGNTLPGTDDIVYSGDPASWIAFANSLKARYELHLSKVDPDNYATKVLDALNATGGAITGSSQNANVQFFDVTTFGNPTFQFQQARGGYLYYSPTPFTEGLAALNDGRVTAYVDTADTGGPTDLIAGQASPVTLLSYTEVLFMEAEAYSAKGDIANATLAYNAAITNSFADAGVSIPDDYLTNPDVALTGATHADRLPKIIQQKYYALFNQPEPYNDWRRTGYPALTPYAGSQIPRRFLYPQTELNTNKANVPTGITLYTPVYWDK